MSSREVPLKIRSIEQQDNHSFIIQWNDGTTRTYQLSDLQKQCPCAGCVDERTGVRRVPPETVKEEVRAYGIKSVGQYALQIQFTAGCSHGIYPFTLLHRIGK